MKVQGDAVLKAEIEGYPVRISSYPICYGFLTEVTHLESGKFVARGAGATALESLNVAVEIATARIQRFQAPDLMVGG